MGDVEKSTAVTPVAPFPPPAMPPSASMWKPICIYTSLVEAALAISSHMAELSSTPAVPYTPPAAAPASASM